MSLPFRNGPVVGWPADHGWLVPSAMESIEGGRLVGSARGGGEGREMLQNFP